MYFAKNRNFLPAAGLVSLIFLTKLVRSEVFTAMADMEELLETEAVLINNLEGYIDVQEAKLDLLKKKVEEYQREHSEAEGDISAYLSNPINAYLLTKRLTSDWRRVENLMAHDVGSEFLKNISNFRNILKFPSDEDLNGAAVALMRLQDTYNLDTASLARGELNGVQYSTEMTSNDCFELGRQSYINGDYYHTMLWMGEAMERLTTEANETSPISKADILEYLAFSTYKQGNIQKALSMTNELLTVDPHHERARGNKEFYEKQLKIEMNENRLKGDDGSLSIEFANIQITKTANNKNDRDITRRKYEMLCRGDIIRSPRTMRPLRCRYVTNTSAFLRIAPIKYEEINLDPLLIQFHDVMTDNEIELVKKLARPRFQRATVQNSETGELETATYRISKSAWLKDAEHKFIADITRRTEQMTGLSMETVEELQVVNYGIGGHYDTHFDFARKEEKNAFKGMNWGNRVATILFYMTDVEQGGATVFPDLEVAVWPKKGTAAFWYNLYKCGEGDYRTSHAACPVLTGSKWVSNKWVHEYGQIFRRPCDLAADGPSQV